MIVVDFFKFCYFVVGVGIDVGVGLDGFVVVVIEDDFFVY